MAIAAVIRKGFQEKEVSILQEAQAFDHQSKVKRNGERRQFNVGP